MSTALRVADRLTWIASEDFPFSARLGGLLDITDIDDARPESEVAPVLESNPETRVPVFMRSRFSELLAMVPIVSKV